MNLKKKLIEIRLNFELVKLKFCFRKKYVSDDVEDMYVKAVITFIRSVVEGEGVEVI